MFEKMKIFATAGAMARHAAQRQAVIAENIANADTPGYRARDLVSFSEVMNGPKPVAMRATRPGHFSGSDRVGTAPQAETVLRPGATSPNGNSVSIEREMFAGAEAMADHERALAVYRSALSVLRTSINTRS